MKKKISFLFPTNRKKLREEVEQGKTSDNGLYGLNHLEKSFDIEVIDVSAAWERILNILLWPIAVLFNSIHTKLNPARVLLAVSRLNSADLVVTCVDSVNKAACLLKKLRILRRPLICMAGNVLDGEENLLLLHKWLWSGADRIITHAPVDQEKLIHLGLGGKGVMIPVGSDSGFFKPQHSKLNAQHSRLMVSVGADRDRDYKTLLEAAEQLPDLRFVICCEQKNIEGLKIHDNVEVRVNVSTFKTRDLLSKAEIVILPLKETHRASGQLALLDAMLMGKPVIVSSVEGVVNTYSFSDSNQALFVRPGRAQELIQAVKQLHADQRLRMQLEISGKKLALGYTTKKYAEKFKQVILTAS